MNNIGHNERTYRLDAIADRARQGLGKVAAGEDETLAGWLAYGAALNEGRALFPGNVEFGQWLRSSNLEERIHPADQAAAMWAAGNSEQFEEAKAAGKARTIRGIHAKWKEIEAKREAERKAAEAKAEAEARKAAEGDAKAAPNPTQPAPDPAPKTSADAGADKAGISAGEPAGGPAPDKPQGPKPADPWRKGLSSLTRDGLEDEVAGLRETLAEVRSELAEVARDRDAIKRQLSEAREALSQENLGAVVSKLQSDVAGLKFQRDEAYRKAKRSDYLRKQAEKAAEIPL